MNLSLYDISVPPMAAAFNHLDRLLAIGREHADGIGVDHSEILRARLAPDMLDLVGQVQRASDTAKYAVVRLTGLRGPDTPDDEDGFDDLAKRIDVIRSFLKSVERHAFDGSSSRTIPFPPSSPTRIFDPSSYLLEFALPNFYFHITAAYAILRHKGAPIGKMDFLGFR